MGAASTIIDADHIDRVLDIHSTDPSLTVAISGVTITHGSAGPSDFGGGIRVTGPEGTILSITESTIADHHAQYGGGVNLANKADVTIAGSQNTQNHADVDGGGMNVDDNTILHVSDTLITDNEADLAGGIMNTDHGTVTADTSTIDHNTVTTYGGSVFNGSTTNVSDTSISSNRARHDGGGGIYTAGGALTVTGSTIANNSMEGQIKGGGGIQQDGQGSVDVVNSTLFGNTSATVDGAIFVQDVVPTNITNTTIVGYTGKGGGIYLSDDGPITLKNTIIAKNDPQNCAHDQGVGDLESRGRNVTNDLSCGLHKPGDSVVNDPLLGDLADNGGHIETMNPLPGSPAIDTGDDDGCPQTEQRCAPRPFDGNSDSVAHCDVGAVEAGLTGYIWGDLRCDGSLDVTDGFDDLLHLGGLPLLQANASLS